MKLKGNTSQYAPSRVSRMTCLRHVKSYSFSWDGGEERRKGQGSREEAERAGGQGRAQWSHYRFQGALMCQSDAPGAGRLRNAGFFHLPFCAFLNPTVPSVEVVQYYLCARSAFAQTEIIPQAVAEETAAVSCL